MVPRIEPAGTPTREDAGIGSLFAFTPLRLMTLWEKPAA